MREWCLSLALVACGVCGVLGCSAGKAPGAGVGGRGPGTAGSSNGATGGQGGATGVTGSGGSGNELAVDPTDGQKDASSDASIDAGVCDDQSIQTYEAVPTVLLLVDTSSSMFEQRAKLWDPLFNALMDPTNGVVAKLQGKVRFGFTSYKSVTRPSGNPTCPVLIDTELKINNYDTIKAAYTAAGTTPTSDYKWETPTGASVAAVAKTLAAFSPDPPGPKFILLVTDGDPDTCAIRDPQCGQDDSIKAVQDAYAAKIGTFVIGIGDILGSTDTTMRVGKDHLQDLANAGTGQPVTPNSPEYAYQQCVTGGLTATYATAAETPGMAPYYTVSSADGTTAQTQLAAAIIDSLAQTRSCTFNMDAQVNGDASLGTLTFNGKTLPFGDPNGWSLGADLISVSLNGAACDSWKKDGGKVNVVFPCKLVPVIHIDVPPPK
ncbi:MAG: vWA domain-containing protein [Polyangiaceae bacterium]